MEIFCKRLKDMRLEFELTQKAVGDIMCVSYNTICSWEKGRSSPDIYELKKLAEFFDVSTDYLLGLKDY